MSIFNYRQRNNIILIAIVVLACLLLYSLSSLFSAILGAIVLFTIFRPGYLYLTEKRNWGRAVTALMFILVSLVVIVIPFLSLSFMVIDKIASVRDDPFFIDQLVLKANTFAGSTFNQPHLIDDFMKKVSVYATDLFPSIISGAASILLTLLVLYFLLYFMLTQIHEFEAGLLKYAPFREQHALKFAVALRNATYSNVLGQGIISVVQGLLLANGFWIVGIPDALFWGIIGAFISFLPVVGAPTLSIPAGIYLFMLGENWKAIGILVYGLLFIGNVDNVLRMIINKRIANTHPIISIIGAFIGIPLFGILGLVFGPVLLSYFLLLVEIYETNRLAADRLDRIKTGNDL
jgi:predicted PurR-regulated permease PerM